MVPAPERSAEVEKARAESTAAHGGDGGGHRTATVNLPFVTAQFRRPDLHLPRRRDVGAAAGAVAARARSLSPTELAYYTGLGVLAAVELLEWPVALVVGAGTALARSGGRERGPSDTVSGGEGGAPGGRAEGSARE
jgi:hypothetical protein